MKKILLVLFLIIVIGLIYVFQRQPTIEANWTEDAVILPDVTIDEDIINIKNIRDWRYDYKETLSRDYYEENFDLDKISKTYFLLNPFGKWEGVAHGFFLFEFEDGKTISVSVEARKEIGEDFGAVRGLFNNFELWYTWGSAADLFSRRAIYHDEDLYIYELLIKPETSRALFLDMVKETEKLETIPQFYNTVSANCTSVLADSSNRANPGSIPWDWARIFTGYADNKLYDLGLISNEKSFEKTFEEARIDFKIKEIFSPNISKEDFWVELQNYFK